MIKIPFKLTVWSLRITYPVMRLLGRLTGKREQMETLIETGEENIERTREAFGWDEKLPPMNDDLARKVEDANVEGWELLEVDDDGTRAVVVDRGYGSILVHILVALLTIWWTVGLGNLAYAGYKYYADAEKKVLRSDEQSEELT